MIVRPRPPLLRRQISTWRVLELVAKAPRRCGSCGKLVQRTCSCHRRKVLQRTAGRHCLMYVLAGTFSTASWHIWPPERLCLDQAHCQSRRYCSSLPDELLSACATARAMVAAFARGQACAVCAGLRRRSLARPPDSRWRGPRWPVPPRTPARCAPPRRSEFSADVQALFM
jgi:hypothetical protein